MSQIRAVVFDFGGVMTTSTMPQRVISLARRKGVDWGIVARGFAAYRLDFDAGFITIGEMYARIWRDAGITVDAAAEAAFIEADTQSWCYRNECTLGWMRALKSRGFKIGILTNMAPAFAREHFETTFADFISLADAMVISGYEGIVKPQRAIYDLLRRRIGLSPRELCFIDDLETNVAAARKAGWSAVRFRSNAQAAADFEALVS